MDDFPCLMADFGFRSQGKSAPMFASKPSLGSGSAKPLSVDDIFGGFKHPNPNPKPSSASSSTSTSTSTSMPVYDKPVYDDDIFDGVPGMKSSMVYDSNRIRVKAPNGLFLQAKSDVLVTADYQEDTTWGDDDPSVFVITSPARLQGEFQITNGYGTEKAAPVLREHWNTFIVEEDFKFISQNRLNGARIPVGWWIASDPMPPWPFVGGSLNALDNVFSWAEKYDLGVIIDLHAAPGSQNGNEHSASRDGFQDWGKTDENIDQTVQVIDFLARRYAKRSGLLAIELMNEPMAPGVMLDSLMKYYQAGYNTVRKYSPDAYVIMSNRLSASSTELLGFASGLKGSVIDVHYYNLLWGGLNGMTVQQNIDFVNTNRSADLNAVTIPNGPPVLVGQEDPSQIFALTSVWILLLLFGSSVVLLPLFYTFGQALEDAIESTYFSSSERSPFDTLIMMNVALFIGLGYLVGYPVASASVQVLQGLWRNNLVALKGSCPKCGEEVEYFSRCLHL